MDILNSTAHRRFLDKKNKYADALLLYFMPSSDVSNAVLTIDDQEYINFSGYNYLNTSGDPRVTEKVIEAIKKYGTSASASRIVSGEKLIHRELEQAIARWLNVESSLIFSAGHATNISAITTLLGRGDLILHDALIHNSSLLGAKYSDATYQSYVHNDLSDLEKKLVSQRDKYKRVLILTEGLFSMDGDIPNIPQMVEIKKRFSASLMIDEAHSIGVLGRTGRGIQEYFDLNPQDVDIWMGTLSKALGSCGGYIAGRDDLIQFLKFNADGFCYSAAISPPNTAAALASLQILQEEPGRVEQLQNNARFIANQLKSAGLNIGNHVDYVPIIPLIVKDDEKALNFSFLLKQKKILAFPILYPAVAKGQARLRLFISCAHQKEQLKSAADIVIDIWKSMELEDE